MGKFWGPKVFWTLDIFFNFGIFAYALNNTHTHISIKMFWGWNPSLKVKLICSLYTPYAYSLKDILYTIFTVSAF